MTRTAKPKDLSLKALELFQLCAHKGSLQAAAQDSGLTISTISHHLRSLETHLGVELFNHARRPMVLTPRGQAFLRNIDDALQILRKAKAEATSGNVTEAKSLRIGTLADFESEIAPQLAVHLSRHMPRCDFLFQTDTSASILSQLQDSQLDLGVTASPAERPGDLQERPLLRDPFVVVRPLAADAEGGTVGNKDAAQTPGGQADLPFLRFSANLIIARQIEAQLRRTGISAPHRFACSSNQTLMAMVAAGAGWTITTPLLFAQAHRFHAKLRLHPFPGKGFARRLSIMSTPDCSASVVALVDSQLRKLLTDQVIGALHDHTPWLKDSLMLID